MRRVLTLAALACLPGMAMGQLSIDWYTIDSGGGTSSGATLTVSGTIGQPDAGQPMSGGTLTVTGGFWAGISSRPACYPDLTTTNTNPGDPGYAQPDGFVNGADISYFVEQWFLASQSACVPCLAIADNTTTNTNPGDPGFGVPDGFANGADISYYVEQWFNGCP